MNVFTPVPFIQTSTALMQENLLQKYPEIWAPYYTLDKIMAGLEDCYLLAEADMALETLYDILLAERCEVTMLDTIASEDDMLYFLKDDRANLISDAIYPAGGKYHPRVYGAFPKLLTDYVRDRKIFSIEDAIYKMTAKPAQVLGLNRGILDKGMPADINIFHLDHLQVHADFQNPDQFCTGFDYVFVNGKMVVSHDTYINQENNMTGMVLKRNQP